MKMGSEKDKLVETGCSHHSNPTFSQCASLREIRKTILSSCHNVGDVSVDDFESVLEDDDDVTSLKQVEETKDVLATSLAESSILSDDADAENSYIPTNRPHVPFSVEEVSLVRSLECWSNRNVRVIGNVIPSLNPESNIWSLQSIGEEGGPFSVAVDMKLLDLFPPANAQVQVFGEIQVVNNSQPMILVKLFRDFSAVDIFHYHKVTEELKKFVPHFINLKSTQRLASNCNEERMNMT